MTDVNRETVATELETHWDMTPAEFAQFEMGTVFSQVTRSGEDTGGKEVDFKHADGRQFFVEVDSNSQVWNMEWLGV